MTDGIESMPELFVQLRQITMGFPKIRGPLQCLRIGCEGSAFILLARRQGAASYRKIGGDLQGEPRLPVDATSARAWQGQDDAREGVQTA